MIWVITGNTRLVLEKILPSDNSKPTCTHASGACPPEDCGGIGGYYNLREVLKNPQDPEYQTTKKMAWQSSLTLSILSIPPAINNKLASVITRDRLNRYRYLLYL
jgi:hypothetical protein